MRRALRHVRVAPDQLGHGRFAALARGEVQGRLPRGATLIKQLAVLGKSINTLQKVTVIPSPDHLKFPLVGPWKCTGFRLGASLSPAASCPLRLQPSTLAR